ncbi:RING finger protein [Hirschfeldia incana]|nr:RING finger protein [Hirschfeldia incana]
MEIEVSSSTNLDSIRVQPKTLQTLLDDCQRALHLLNLSNVNNSDSPDREEEELSSSDSGDSESDKLNDLIKSRVECHEFRDRLELAQASVHLLDVAAEDGSSSWDVVSDDDLNIWGLEDDDDYVVVREEDIADAIASFMVTYLSSLEQTKDVSPDQLQKALSTMFSVKKRKGKLRKAWEGSKVIYNLASWSATAIGIYQNPMILSIASKAFWVSFKAISKLV